MRTVKISELVGSALNWAVAKCEGQPLDAWRNDYLHTLRALAYSTNWQQGGPIIEREGIHIATLPSGLDVSIHTTFKAGDLWEAEKMRANMDSILVTGPTPLIAAMRAYVASKLGEYVTVPEELI